MTEMPTPHTLAQGIAGSNDGNVRLRISDDVCKGSMRGDGIHSVPCEAGGIGGA